MNNLGAILAGTILEAMPLGMMGKKGGLDGEDSFLSIPFLP